MIEYILSIKITYVLLQIIYSGKSPVLYYSSFYLKHCGKIKVYSNKTILPKFEYTSFVRACFTGDKEIIKIFLLRENFLNKQCLKLICKKVLKN